MLDLLESCEICPNRCRVNRLENETASCLIGRLARVPSFGPHFGEEPPISGRRGSGTIFFSGCNLHCKFCQNHDISQAATGRETTEDELADLMLYMEELGCHNVNFVSPTHVVPQVITALETARHKGLTLPVVYNSGGCDCVETLKNIDGKIQVYMPDAKYANPDAAEKYSGIKDYPRLMKAAIREMHRQVGDLEIIDGVAVRGLLVRHLVLPNGLAGSKEIIDFLAEEISEDTCINVMAQYRPCYRANGYPEIARYPTKEEFLEAYNYAVEKGLRLVR